MGNKLINWRESLIELFPEATERVKSENDEWCQTCKGVGLIRSGNSVGGCYACNGTGIIKSCECGNKLERGYTLCGDCRKKKEEDKELTLFDKANKIKFKDYDGLFLFGDNVIDKEDLIDIIYDQIYEYGHSIQHIYATKKYKLFDSIDLIDVLNDKCEDGYEDMIERFNFKDADFLLAQEHLNKWLKKHEDILDIYYEDFNNCVMLDDVIGKIKEDRG